MAVFEAGYKDEMDEKDAMELVDQAVQAGIWNDLGSGGNVDLLVITKKGSTSLRTYKGPRNERPPLQSRIHFPKGTTEVTKTVREVFPKHEEEKAMDTSVSA